MRIQLTSVAETKREKEIESKIRKLFPDYTVTVIPNKYATKEGKEQVQEYAKQYYQKNAEKIRKERIERYYKQKEERAEGIKNGYYNLAKKLDELDR